MSDLAGLEAAFSARALSLRLMRFSSVTGTAGERDFAPFLRDLLMALPYFRAHPGDLTLLSVPGDRWVAGASWRWSGGPVPPLPC